MYNRPLELVLQPPVHRFRTLLKTHVACRPTVESVVLVVYRRVAVRPRGYGTDNEGAAAHPARAGQLRALVVRQHLKLYLHSSPPLAGATLQREPRPLL